MSYKESKMMLNKIRDDYGCKGEIIFRSALPIVVEAGQCTILDDEWYQCEIDNIHEKHNQAETEGKWLWITRDFEIAILECAKEIAKVPAMDLLQYVQKEVWLSGDGIDYQRAIKLLKYCMGQIEAEEDYNHREIHTIFADFGFYDDEIEALGFGYLLEEEE